MILEPVVAVTIEDMANRIGNTVTTVHQPIYAIGGQVCELLVQVVHGGAPLRDQLIRQPTQVIGRSTGPAPR